MNHENRSVELSYNDVSLIDGEYDVSFDLTEDAEEALFSSLSHLISEDIDRGVLPEQHIHLYKRLIEQHAKFPPWVDSIDEDYRTYDLKLTTGDYRILTNALSHALTNVLRPAGADTYMELHDAWESITNQMVDQDPHGDDDGFIIDPETPSDKTFDCFIRGGEFRKHSSGDGFDEWVECDTCEAIMSKEDIDEHRCD